MATVEDIRSRHQQERSQVTTSWPSQNSFALAAMQGESTSSRSYLSYDRRRVFRQIAVRVVRLGHLGLDRLVVLTSNGEVNLVMRLFHGRVPLTRAAKEDTTGTPEKTPEAADNAFDGRYFCNTIKDKREPRPRWKTCGVRQGSSRGVRKSRAP